MQSPPPPPSEMEMADSLESYAEAYENLLPAITNRSKYWKYRYSESISLSYVKEGNGSILWSTQCIEDYCDVILIKN